MSENPVNINIVEGEPFFAHEMSVNFTPTQFTLDFKCITPRNDPRSKKQPNFLLKHNVVMLDPWHMKAIHEVLGNMVAGYEKEFGKIDKPKSLAKAEKKQKAKVSKVKTESAPSYLG